MTYRVVITRRAGKTLQKLSETTRQRIVVAIAQLADDPRPHGVKKLSGRDEYRVRIGDHRVIYVIEDAVLTVTVVKVGHRRDVYEG